MSKGIESHPHQIVIKEGYYPFKSAQLFKIFDIIIFQQLSLDPKIIHKLLQAYHQIKNPLLINIMNISTNPQSKITKIQYENVETSLFAYLLRFLNQNIQIKIEKLLIQIRDLAHKFVTKKINILNAISCKNIGVKMKDLYRQSMFVAGSSNNEKKKNSKEIVMPDFKIFIDFSKCQIIQKQDQIARIAIETDKVIYKKIRAQIDDLLKQAESAKCFIVGKSNGQIPAFLQSQSLKNIPAGNLFCCNYSENVIPENNFQFSKNLKKRKKKMDKKQISQETNNINNKIVQTHTQAFTNENNQNAKLDNRKQSNDLFKSTDLSNKVDLVVERSRKALQAFRKTIKLYQ